VFLSVLQVHGFAVVETESTLKIIPDTLAKQSNIPIIDSEKSGDEEDIVVRIIKINNIAAAQLVTLLQPLVSKVGHLAAYQETNSVIVADRANNIERLMKIIDRIDQVGTIDIEIIKLHYASAKELVNVISTLLPKAKDKADGKELAFSIDERSNSILMTGDPSSRQQVGRLIKKLDQPIAGDGNTRVVPLNFIKAKELLPIIKGLSGTVVKSNKDNGGVNVDVDIQISEQNNALIITAPPTLQASIDKVIEKLDVRRAQVLVEAMIVEVNNDLAHGLGIEWKTNLPSKGEIVGMSAIPKETELKDFPSLGTGLTLGFYSRDSLRALIRALESDSSANVLSTPTVVTLDNEEAEILVGENVPFVTGEETSSASTTNNPFRTIQRQDIGVTLKVKPSINNENSITLEIEQSVESISDTAAATADIITNKRNIKTRVLIDDDTVLVLGGLIRDEVNDSKSRVPFLGKVPFIGALFRSDSHRVIKKNLMVFIHPRILRNQDNNSEVTKSRYESMRDLQSDFDSEGSWIYKPGQPPVLQEMPSK